MHERFLVSVWLRYTISWIPDYTNYHLIVDTHCRFFDQNFSINFASTSRTTECPNKFGSCTFKPGEKMGRWRSIIKQIDDDFSQYEIPIEKSFFEH